MSLGFFFGLTLSLGGILGTAGCKKHSNEAVSPIVNPPATSTDPVDPADDPGVDPADDPTAGGAVAPAPPPAPSNEKDWREDDEDDKSVKAPKNLGSKAGASKFALAPKKGKAKETPEEKKKRLDREATLRSVDGALRGATASMKRCYDQGAAKAGSATISFRVHRSGYVMSPSVSGVSGSVKTCIEGVLNRLRVSAVKTPSLNVTRTLRFSRY